MMKSLVRAALLASVLITGACSHSGIHSQWYALPENRMDALSYDIRWNSLWDGIVYTNASAKTGFRDQYGRVLTWMLGVLEVNEDCSLARVADWASLSLHRPTQILTVVIPAECAQTCRSDAAFLQVNQYMTESGMLPSAPGGSIRIHSCEWHQKRN